MRGLTIDYAERLVTLRGIAVSVTPIEYRLLVELSANAGRVITYEQLLSRVWGSDGAGDVRPIRTAISAIRGKLGDAADSPAYVFTELRVGYKMPRPENSLSPASPSGAWRHVSVSPFPPVASAG